MALKVQPLQRYFYLPLFKALPLYFISSIVDVVVNNESMVTWWNWYTRTLQKRIP